MHPSTGQSTRFVRSEAGPSAIPPTTHRLESLSQAFQLQASESLQVREALAQRVEQLHLQPPRGRGAREESTVVEGTGVVTMRSANITYFHFSGLFPTYRSLIPLAAQKTHNAPWRWGMPAHRPVF